MSRQSKKRRKREEAEREGLLSPDAFEAQGATWSGWLEKNIKLVIAAIVLVLVGVVGFELVRSSSDTAAAEDTQALIEAVDAYGEAVSLQTIFTSSTAEERNEGYRDARAKLQDALAGDGNEELKAVARLYDADLARRLEDYDAALAGYDAYLSVAEPNDPLRFFALEGKGYTLEGKGDIDAALATYEKIASMERFADYGWKHVARVLRERGDLEGAKAAYERIASREPPSPLKGFAEQQITLLE